MGKNAAQLFLADGSPTRVWYCIVCGIVHPSDGLAGECCRPKICKQCGLDIPKTRRHFETCTSCERLRLDEEYKKRLAAAELVSDYDGWIYTGEVTGLNDGYFSSVQDLIDEIEDGDEDGPRLPEFAFCCNPEPPQKVDSEDVIEQTFNDSHEEASEGVPEEAREELQAALDKFYESVRGIVSYTPDYKRKVAVR